MDHAPETWDEAVEAYEKLYEQIPASTCKDGCFECCTNMIQFMPAEEANMGGYTYTGKCNHLVDGKCTIYTRRPFVCRIFGSSSIMSCEGCTPERYLSEEETRRLFREYVSIEGKKSGK